MTNSPLPYGRQSISDEDVDAVAEALRSDWLTTGPKVGEFERAFASYVGAREAVAVSNGTAALHALMRALGVGPGDEVIVPTMTFAATSNAALYEGATPVFADVDAKTLLLDPASVEARITPRTKAVVAVDYAGQPADYVALRKITDRHGLKLASDGCHAVGATERGRPVGSIADLTAFSFHPVKHLTTGEGGMITTNDATLAQRMRVFRNHGITTTHREREHQGSWEYDMEELGYNYRLTDVMCALGLSQLARVPAWVARRREIAARYDKAFAPLEGIEPLAVRDGVEHAYHLYVVQVDANRAAVFHALRKDGIGVNVHYRPVHLHPYYRRRFGTKPGDHPAAEAAYERILSIPMFPLMTDADVDRVVEALARAVRANPRRST